MFEQEITEPATIKWAAPIVSSLKKDGMLRFCVNYRWLNAVNQRDSYLIPRMDEYIDVLEESIVFSTPDFTSGYWQVEIGDEDRNSPPSYLTAAHIGSHERRLDSRIYQTHFNEPLMW